jgi:hypothetical protein
MAKKFSPRVFRFESFEARSLLAGNVAASFGAGFLELEEIYLKHDKQ